jgi:hypothetical protein
MARLSWLAKQKNGVCVQASWKKKCVKVKKHIDLVVAAEPIKESTHISFLHILISI